MRRKKSNNKRNHANKHNIQNERIAATKYMSAD